MATGMFENDTSGNCLQQPGVPDSPDSIPLPDSPPPETEDRVAEVEALVQNNDANPNINIAQCNLSNNNNACSSSGGSSSSSSTKGGGGSGRRKTKRNSKPRIAEEYDPSEPLTSSDEEEHSLQLIEGESCESRNTQDGNINKSSRNNNSCSGSNSNSNNSSVLESGRNANTSPKLYRLSSSTTPPPSSASSRPSASNKKPISPKYSQEQQRTNLTTNSSSSSSNNESSRSNSSSSRVDLTTIPVPPEENRRPTIHFSIPTRHRLLPISTLIKRQKGIAKKDLKDGTGSQGEFGKGFDKSGDDEDDEEDSDENRPKISLVAEIFGNDDEDDENEEETEQQNVQQTVESHLSKSSSSSEQQQSEGAGVQLNNIFSDSEHGQQQQSGGSDKSVGVADGSSGRWKLVAVADEPTITISNSIIEPDSPSPKQLTENDDGGESTQQFPFNAPVILPQGEEKEKEDTLTGEVVAEDEPEIIEIVTINVPPSNRMMRPLRRRPFMGRMAYENGGEPEVIDIIDKEDEELESVSAAPVSNTNSSPSAPLPSLHSRRTSSERRARDASNERERGERLRPERPIDSSPERERYFKRPHSSSSMSNCEEGEIIDQVNPSKKRKKDRKKKTKRRKRSRDSISPPSKSSEKRLSDVPPQHGSSDHEEETGSRGAISWRKPSKRTQNRNYRDGKPKADDTFFREKETDDKSRSISPSHRRNKSRKDKSPLKEKSGGKHRRDASPRNRSHSKSPGRMSRSRSRSIGRPYRNRRRNRHSRSRSSNSVSDKSRSGRSTSRKRSRRRYRRSTSRHHVGDSRSPSYITEPIRSRSSHYSKLRDRSRSRSRGRHARARYRKRSISRSKSPTPSPRSHKKSKKPESLDRPQKKRQLKEKDKALDASSLSDAKEKKKEKEKLKEREKRKKKEKPKEEEKVKPKEKVKEKEKKKKKKRREKSPTPVKAIVADGDSIVVSLSFQKGKTASSSSNAQSSSSAEDHSKNGLLETSTNSESSGKQSNKTNADGEAAIDFNEEQERSQNSPAKLSSVTDEEGTTTPPPSCPIDRPKSNDEKETEAVKVTSSGGGSCGSSSPFEAERSFSAAADSTKVATPQAGEPHENSFGHSRRSSSSPTDMESSAQGDSLVTSTGDSIEPPATADDDSTKSNSSSTPSKPADSNKLFPGLGHKVNASQMSPRLQGTQTSSATAPSTETSNGSSSSVPPASTTVNSGGSSTAQNTTPIMSRPLIGNIPGLYPSSAIPNSSGAAPVPPPIVIPTPPPPQGIRFASGSAPMLNPNVLASVASALLAVRQSQPPLKMTSASGMNSVENNSSSQLRHMNALNSRNQTFPVQPNSRGASGNSFSGQEQGGDSPMSPNSSDGDDLFEPPTERPQGDAGTNGTGKLGKNGQLFANAPVHGGNNASDAYAAPGTNKQKGNSSLFDSLFGGNEAKKVVANKPEKILKSKAKHRKGGGSKKETIKVNTSGGLTEGELRLTDEVPTSAVELIVKQKYLKKLNRQERVVEEVKLSLKPYYSKRQVNKDEYKEILRRAVPKICHNKTGEINPGKIKELVEAYVKKFRHARKRGDVSNAK